jgi:GDP-4-dehydro-6-deoxy-D-mannose reductase
MTRRILITGGQGFIGRHLARDYLQCADDIEVVAIGRSPEIKRGFSHKVSWGTQAVVAPLDAELRLIGADPRYRYQSVDVLDQPALTELLAGLRPDVVVHLATALRDESIERLTAVNINAVDALLRSLSRANVRPSVVVLGSTGGVYGDPGTDLPIPETAPCMPLDRYAISKFAGELLGRHVASQLGITVVCARIFNPCGPGQDERHVTSRLATQVASIANGIRSPEIEVGPLDATRDFVDVRDVTRALRLMVERGASGEVYNVGRGVETKVSELLREYLDQGKIRDRVVIRRDGARSAGVLRHCADIRKLRAIGFRPMFGLSEMVASTLAYYQGSVRVVATSESVGRLAGRMTQ